jgi:hypothetical protein
MLLEIPKSGMLNLPLDFRVEYSSFNTTKLEEQFRHTKESIRIDETPIRINPMFKIELS